MRKSEKKAESSAKVPLSATLAVIIRDKSNHLYQLHSTCQPNLINPPRTTADVTSPVVHLQKDNKLAQTEHFNKIGKVI